MFLIGLRNLIFCFMAMCHFMFCFIGLCRLMFCYMALCLLIFCFMALCHLMFCVIGLCHLMFFIGLCHLMFCFMALCHLMFCFMALCLLIFCFRGLCHLMFCHLGDDECEEASDEAISHCPINLKNKSRNFSERKRQTSLTGEDGAMEDLGGRNDGQHDDGPDAKTQSVRDLEKEDFCELLIQGWL